MTASPVPVPPPSAANPAANAPTNTPTNTATEAAGDLVNQGSAIVSEIWTYELPIGAVPVTIGKLVIAVGVFFVGLMVAKIISRHMGRRVLPRLRVERGPASAIQSIVYYLLLLAALLFSLQIASVPLTIFTIFGGALALGIGFGSQNLISNFMSGLILLLERPIAVGDLVEVDGRMGTVEAVGARATRLRNYHGREFIIPNSILLEQSVSNWNKSDDLVRAVVSVGAAYGSPTEAVRDSLLACAKGVPAVLESPAPMVYFSDFADSALVFELHFWTNPASLQERFQVESDLRFAIDAAFRAADLVIAFPQQDVHLDTQRPLEVKVLA